MTRHLAQDRDLEGLMRFLEERAATPFKWGRRANDCVSCGAGAVEAQIGTDPIPELDWSDEDEAEAALAAEGGLWDALDRRFSRVRESGAKRGDLATVHCPRRGAGLMVVEGETLVGPAARGLRRMPRSAMTGAWDVESLRVGPPAPTNHSQSTERADEE